ncbi:hypothetical protein RN053_07065 [Pantoea dispersa]|uniref:hypothetical protein n=1 Tax=Pantoea dispersa TaxID=59814 RepID=UPI0028E0073F|nr:hypothetical protein [Pantoea dispersa]MDT8850241.1 hypothetical protein [Pantoea dispersa]
MTNDDIRPLNYCLEAIKDLTKLAEDLARVAPYSAYSIRNIIQMLRDSQKFILPNCAEFIAPEDIRQTHLDLARLPYPIVAFEAPWVKHEPVGEDPLHPMMLSTKRIALCWELDRDFEPVPGCNRNEFVSLPDGGVFIVSIYWNDAEQKWFVVSGGCFYPYNNTLKKASAIDDAPESSQQAFESLIRAGRASKSSKGYACEPFVVLKEPADAAMRQLGSEAAYNTDIILNTFDELSAFINACSILNCANVVVDSLQAGAPKQRKFVRGKRVAPQLTKDLPAYSYKVLQIAEERSAPVGNGELSGASVAQRRMHLRRGHIRRLEDRTIWVRAAVINAGSGTGVVDKDYRLVRTPK